MSGTRERYALYFSNVHYFIFLQEPSFPSYTFPIASFGWGPGDFVRVLQGFFSMHISCAHYFRCHKHKLKPASFLSERTVFLYSFIIYIASLSGVVLACLSLIEDTNYFTAFVHYQDWADLEVH